MMRRFFFFFLVFLMALPVAMMAQEYPKAEVFGGYSYVRAQGLNINGWSAAVAGNANHWFGVKADYLGTRFGGETQNNARLSFGIVFRSK